MDIMGNMHLIAQVIMVDLVMAADNAIIVGTAAAALAPAHRNKAIFIGILGATILRIVFALFATQLLAIVGLLLAGGLLLLWVTWKMFQDTRSRSGVLGDAALTGKPPKSSPKKLSAAVQQIILADVSMSLDNVLAVAGIARDHVPTLIIGLCVAVVLMAVASKAIASLVHRYHWIAYAGIAVVFYVSLKMIWDGANQLGLLKGF